MKLKSVEEILAKRIGLDPESLGRSTVNRAVEKRMSLRGDRNVEEYSEELSFSENELRLLIDNIVIAETWFFRDPETFGVLREWATNWCRVAAPNQELTALSMGCCTGEEPYSIAMALLDAGLPSNRLRIDSLDISDRVLQRAKGAIYGENSFRTNDLAFRDRYFRLVNATYHLAESIKSLVRFAEGNILDDELLPGRQYDAVFCRNVLIYFDQDAQDKAVCNLRRLMAPRGMLFAGPAESFLILQKGLTLGDRMRGFSVDDSVSLQQRRSVPTVPLDWKAPLIRRTKISADKPQQSTAAKSAGVIEARVALNEIESLANSGRLIEAGRMCKTYLAETGPSAEAYYLHGLILDASDQKAEAAASYRKALYLEPSHVEALNHLALLTENMGDAASAARLRERIDRAQGRNEK